MIVSLEGIIISSFDYSETSIICKIFTSEYGLQSFMAKGVRKKNSKFKRNLFTPLTIVEITANQKNTDSIIILRDIHCKEYCNDNQTNIQKIAISLYISELLNKTLFFHTVEKSFYNFLYKKIIQLNQHVGSLSMFALTFTAELIEELGISPLLNTYSDGSNFSLTEGRFYKNNLQSDYLSIEDSILVKKLFKLISEKSETIDFSVNEKRVLFSILHLYLKIHIPNFNEIKSVDILKNIL